MTSEHNDHRIRRQKNPDIVHGKPLLMYVRPEDFGEEIFFLINTCICGRPEVSMVKLKKHLKKKGLFAASPIVVYL